MIDYGDPSNAVQLAVYDCSNQSKLKYYLMRESLAFCVDFR